MRRLRLILWLFYSASYGFPEALPVDDLLVKNVEKYMLQHEIYLKIMKIMTRKYRKKMYQVITRTFFIFSLFSILENVSCVEPASFVSEMSCIHAQFFLGQTKMFIDGKCLFVVKVSIYQLFQFPVP